MTKEQEGAIERCNKLIETKHSNWIGISNQKAIETVLNMLKEKDEAIKKYKKLLADNLVKGLNNSLQAKQKADTDLEDLNEGWKIELNKKDKMIDLILDKINENYNNTFNNDEVKEIIEIYENIKNKNKLKGLDLRKECIKQYFERKVE